MRPPSSAIIAILKPPPSRRAARPGTRQSSKVSGTVFEARRPSLSSCLPTLQPGRAPCSTKKPRSPWSPGRRCAPTPRRRPAYAPEVIHCFCPSRIPPSRCAPRGAHAAGVAAGLGLAERERPGDVFPEVSAARGARAAPRCRSARSPRRPCWSPPWSPRWTRRPRAISVMASEYDTTPPRRPRARRGC
jgi:hypothetical protein